jgi:hypothetical protein
MNICRNFTISCHFLRERDGITETLCLFYRNHIFTFSLLDICMLTCYTESENFSPKWAVWEVDV